MRLEATDLKFASKLDEDMFFTWIDGKGRKIFLEIPDSIISNDQLRELVGLFERYQIDMKQLAILANDQNRTWFEDNRESYWHKKVFG